MTMPNNRTPRLRSGIASALLGLALPFAMLTAAATASAQTAAPAASAANAAAAADGAGAAGTAAGNGNGNADAAAGAAGEAATGAEAEQPLPAELPAGQHPAPAIDTADAAVQSLLANSPFMSKAFKERLAKSDTGRIRELSFRGFAGNGDVWLINVYNNKNKQSQWVRLGDQINGITIAEFDKEGLRIKILKDATSVYLDLERHQ